MTIRVNYYLNVRDKDGKPMLFGKVGYQTMSPKTDRFTAANLASIERALKAGELHDLDGNVVYNNAVLDVYALVSETAGETIEPVSSLRNASGSAAVVPAAPAPEANPDDDEFV